MRLPGGTATAVGDTEAKARSSRDGEDEGPSRPGTNDPPSLDDDVANTEKEVEDSKADVSVDMGRRYESEPLRFSLK
jgi:hypothetical protein